MERLSIIALSALLAGMPAGAQDSGRRQREYFDRTPEDCISLSRVRDTAIIDESTILFYLRGGRTYRNVLERSCPGLDSRRVLGLTTRNGRLCRSDTIEHFSVLGGRAYPGIFCKLGKFHPITREEAALIELDPDELSAVRSTAGLTPVDPDDGEPVENGAAAPEGSGTGTGPAAPEGARPGAAPFEQTTSEE